MTFEEKVKLLRTLPQFKVVRISELRAIAFAIKEVAEPRPNSHIIGESGTNSLILDQDDIQKIVRVYPDLEPKFKLS